jgi:hypothetical protein
MVPESFPQQRNTQEHPNLLLHPVCLNSIAADSGSDALIDPGYRNRDASLLKKSRSAMKTATAKFALRLSTSLIRPSEVANNSMPSFGPTTNQITNLQSCTTGQDARIFGNGALSVVRAARSV